MLLYTTKFPVKDALTDEFFVELVLKWVEGSPHYHFSKLHWNGNLLSEATDVARLEILKFAEEKIIAVRLEHRNSRNELWRNHFFFSYLPENQWVATQLFCERNDDSKPLKMRLPYLLKQIQEQGYAGFDKNLPVTNVPLYLDENTMEEYSQVLTQKNNYQMPVVYISRRYDGAYAVDGAFLAKLLSGTAHVIVEQDAAAANELLRLVKGRKPYNGAVTIFFSKTNYQKFLFQDLQMMTDCEEKLAKLIYQWLLQFENEERFSWSHWNAKRYDVEKQQLSKKITDYYEEKLRIQNEQQEQLIAERDALQNIKEFQEIVDAVLDEKDDEIERLKEQNYRLQAQIDNMALTREKRTAHSGSQPILFLGQEDDFYPDEQKDIVLDILQKELKNLQGVKGNSRRKDILESLLKSNEAGGLREEKLQLLQEAMGSYRGMDSSTKSKLEEVGFAIKMKNHYALLFFDDPRYNCTCAKTPSDQRAGMNNVKTIEKLCF